MLFATGRTALKVVAEAIAARRPGRPFLLPAYLCESVLQPFLELNLDVELYRVDGRLRLDPSDLRAKVDALHPAAVLFIDYFGFPPDAGAADALAAARESSLLVEDCVPGSLIESTDAPVGIIGDVVLTSFVKYLPVPDGALVIDRAQLGLPEPPPADGALVARRVAAQLLRRDRALEDVYLRVMRSIEESLDARVPEAGASDLTLRLLAGLDLRAALERRRRNFEALLASLPAPLEPLYRELPDRVSPLAFPVRVPGGRRDALRSALIAREVYCAVHWPLPRRVDAGEFPDSALLADEILSFPIDQRYDDDDMALVAQRAADALREVS